jgi:hypothetical protein
MLCLLAACLGGCGLSAPKLPTPIAMPEVKIEAVHLMDSGPEGSRYQIALAMSNPNDEALPLTFAWYALSVAGGQSEYQGDGLPNATLPAGGSIRFVLPAVVASSGQVGQNYQATGSIQMRPPGQIKNVFYELGLPLPRASFNGSGAVQPAPPPPVRKGGRVEDAAPPIVPAAPSATPSEPRTLPPPPM